MAATTPSTIVLKTLTGAFYKELISGGTITPGNVVELYNASGTLKVRRQSVASTYAQKFFAVENDVLGKSISTDSVVGDVIKYVCARPGDEIYATVAANAVAIVKGDFLETDGAGGVRNISVGVVSDIAGTLTGTTDGTIVDVSAIALSTSNTYSDAAVNSAVNTAITSVNLQLKEIVTKVNALLPAGLYFPFAQALESVDNSAGSSVARIKIVLL